MFTLGRGWGREMMCGRVNLSISINQDNDGCMTLPSIEVVVLSSPLLKHDDLYPVQKLHYRPWSCLQGRG